MQITRVTNNFGEIRRWMSYLERVKLASDRDLTPASLYYVQVRAEIRTIKLVFPLNVLLFFVSFWDVDTPWSNSAYFALANRK